jgi:pimeloyl-ACP methyl ester carboxylesterase
MDDAYTTRYRTVEAAGVKIFYREAGRVGAPTLLLLHGYPSSSRMFEPLLPLLADTFHVVAPDYPGFGHSQAPDRNIWPYSFDSLAKVMTAFVDALGLERYTLYMQDYGGPVGFRMALQRPQRLRSLIIQNAVLHEEGLTDIWQLRRAFWADREGYKTAILEGMTQVKAGEARHVGGRPNPERFNPDLWMDEIAFLERPGVKEAQLDLVFAYQSNVDAYPRWQAWLRDSKVPLLVVWGMHDPIFSTRAVQAIQGERPDAQVHLLDAGHFATNDVPADIAAYVREFAG